MELLKEFEEYLKENYSGDEKENTIKNYLSDVKQFFNYYKEEFGEIISDFNHIEITEYKNYMKNTKSYKYTTINRKIASLSIYDNFMIEKKDKKAKAVKKSDFTKIVRPYISADMLPRNEIKKVKVKAARTNIRDYVIFVLLNEGGLRVSELTNIEIDRDLDVKNRRLYVLGKGNKLRGIIITDNMLEAINEYIPERNKILGKRTNKYLFISNKTVNTGKAITRNSINNMLNKYCDELKIPRFNPHIFRHDFGTTSYELGYSELFLKNQMGDSSNAINIYIHPGKENLLEISNKR